MHYRAAIISRDGDFERLIEPYYEGNEEMFTKHYTNAEERYNKFLEQNPGWAEYGLDYFCKNFDIKKDDTGYYQEYNDQGRYDWHTPDGGEWIASPYITTYKDELKVDDIDWRSWEKDWKKYDETERPYLFVDPDGQVHAPGYVYFIGSTDTEESSAKYEEEFWDIQNKYKGMYIRFDDWHT